MSSNEVVSMENVTPMVMEREERLVDGGLEFPRSFVPDGVNPYDEIVWEKRSAVISNEKGEDIFRQDNVEIPKRWSQAATNIVVSKYFHGQPGTPATRFSFV